MRPAGRVAELGSLGRMKTLATLDAEVAAGQMERLASVGIACESRVVTEESGIGATEVLVTDSGYDAACDVVDAWQDDQAREARMVCPKCRSPHLERVPHDSVEVLFRCKDCGCEVLAQT